MLCSVYKLEDAKDGGCNVSTSKRRKSPSEGESDIQGIRLGHDLGMRLESRAMHATPMDCNFLLRRLEPCLDQSRSLYTPASLRFNTMKLHTTSDPDTVSRRLHLHQTHLQ